MDDGPFAASPDLSVQDEIARLGPWFHNLHLPGGVETAPDHPLGDFPAKKWRELRVELPEDLSGWTALDVGCNAGFYAFELARRGAHVTAIDSNAHYLDQARWAARQLHLADRITFRQQQVYSLARESGRYDIVLFLGVLYHLRYPMLGLDIVTGLVRRLLCLQTLTFPDSEQETQAPNAHERESLSGPGRPRMTFIEHAFADDPTNWWVPNHSCVAAMLRTCGMGITARPGRELYVCRPDPAHCAVARDWDRQELDSVLDRDARSDAITPPRDGPPI